MTVARLIELLRAMEPEATVVTTLPDNKFHYIGSVEKAIVVTPATQVAVRAGESVMIGAPGEQKTELVVLK